MRLENTTALVTGSSQGIGRGIALRLAREGADVVINYHSHPEEADNVVKEVQALGRKAVAFGADLASVSECQKLVEDSLKHFGKVDLLVNNAGIEKNASFWDVTERDYDAVLNVNLKGV